MLIVKRIGLVDDALYYVVSDILKMDLLKKHECNHRVDIL